MHLSSVEIENHFNNWIIAWNNHDIEGVLSFMHEDIIFENWNGSIISSKNNLRKVWTPWFLHHGNFKFILEDYFIDEAEQKMTFAWQLDWPSLERNYTGKKESRNGVDIMQLKEGKIFKKNTYSKTILLIDDKKVQLNSV